MRIIISVLLSLGILAVPAFGQACVTTKPPKDAVVLVKGDDCSLWKAQDGGPCPWPTKDGVMTVEKTNVMTKQVFGDVQLHIEFRIPPKTNPEDHGHGNSGVYLHGDYEIQVIDSHGREPHEGESCGAIYAQKAPLTDAALPAGEWQSFDVLFRAPVYDAQNRPVKKAVLTVFHNGVCIHDHVECDPTPGGLTDYFKHKGPLWLQSHGHAVSFRNIWLRELPPVRDAKVKKAASAEPIQDREAASSSTLYSSIRSGLASIWRHGRALLIALGDVA